MMKLNSLLSSLALGVGLTLSISTSAIASPKYHNTRQSGVRVIRSSGILYVTPRRNSRSVDYNSRYNHNPRRDYHGRDYDYDCRDRRRARRRRRHRNLTIVNPPVYRNNLAVPRYIKIRTVR